MVDADRERFDRIMTTLAELYGEASILKRQAYWMALREHPFADVEAAVIRCLRTRISRDGYPAPWPTPGDLVALMYRNLDAVPDPPVRTDRKALSEAPPDPTARHRIRAMIRRVIDSLPDGPVRTAPHLPMPAGPPKSRQQILREVFAVGGGKAGEFSALALRAGYDAAEILEAQERATQTSEQSSEAQGGSEQPR